MIIEQNTNYAYKLKYMENPTFDKVRDLAIKFMRELPTQLQDELYEALNRGIDILDSEPQMVTYLYAFGPMHQAKLNYAFKQLPKEFLEQPEINIIDYGCGQALGTMCYADYLRENGYSQKVKTITLIEPSEMCLKRAALHASVFFPDAEIKIVNKSFDELDKEDIFCDKNISTIHVLSNVLDNWGGDLTKFTELIKSQIKGYNQFICIPSFEDNRMYDFRSLMVENSWGSFNGVLDSFCNPGIAWTPQVCGFLIGRPPKKFSKDEIVNCFEDEFGVVYSKDGKQLLKCKNDIKEYSIKNNTVIIGEDAFKECSSLKQINIPDSVTIIGEYAFEKCLSLQNIIIPNSVKKIELGAFSGCESLKQVIIPNSVSRIGEETFCGCLSLKHIVIPDSVSSIGPFAFAACSSLQQIIIPDSVSDIGYSAFVDCTSLQQIIIPDLVSVIEECTFSGCSALRYVIISDSIEQIFQHAFSGCISLNRISIPDSVTGIGEGAFSGCSSLQQITIPSSVEDIGHNPFCGCENLKLDSDSSRFIVKEGLLIDNQEAMVVACVSKNINIVIPDSIASIGEGAFIWCKSLQQIIIPDSVECIGYNAFYCCISLRQVTIPDSVEYIGYKAFYGCESLQRINIPVGSTEKFKEIFDEDLWGKLVEE